MDMVIFLLKANKIEGEEERGGEKKKQKKNTISSDFIFWQHIILLVSVTKPM